MTSTDLHRRIVVTGGAGFIGCNLVRRLINVHDCHVLVVDKLTYAGNLESLADLRDDPRLEICVADICDAETLEPVVQKFQPDAVMHLAAESHVDRSIDGPEAFIQTNIVGTFRLLQLFRGYWESLPEDRRERFRFLHVSTDEVYGSLAMGDPAFTESTPYDPHSPYSASKASSDHLARAWHDTYGFPVLITNCSNNYGPYQFPEKLIPVVILKALSGQAIPVYGKGENVRDWLYVDDHTEALYQVVTRGQPGQTYNIGGNNEQSNIDLVRKLCGILDELRPAADNVDAQAARPGLQRYEELIEFVTDRPGHDLRYAIDASKIRDELGWQPSETFETGFRKTVQWYLDNDAWWRNILSGDYQLDRQGLNVGGGKS